jgi:hypothetical protein
MTLFNAVVVVAALITLLLTTDATYVYNVSSTGGLDRHFDGIGGLSGGDCSTSLLADTVEFGTIK